MDEHEHLPGSTRTPGPVSRRLGVWASVLLVLGAGLAAPTSAQQGDRSCDLCHGELEFLRQHTPDLASARSAQVTLEVIANSAHAEYTCADCHGGFSAWPHPDGGTTESCVSCHEEQDTAWSRSIHAEPETGEPAECASCHTVHDIAWADDLAEGPEMTRMNAGCVSCHQASAFASFDAHADSVACAGCHPAHETHPVDSPEAVTAPLSQVETCGSCHEDVSTEARHDAHGEALTEKNPATLTELEDLGHDGAPSCTTCHSGHGVVAVDGPFAMDETSTCGTCHEHAVETFDDSYHGQATALGSEDVASCSDCHGTHGVFGEDDERSMIHPANLVESCGTCHEESRAGFVQYQPHADHNDRENYPEVYWSYRAMTALLLGVFSVFGIHSALWVMRLALDARKQPAGGER